MVEHSRSKRKFQGALAEPVKWNGPIFRELAGTIIGGNPTNEQRAIHRAKYEAARQEAVAALTDKMFLLQEHFGIKTDDGGLNQFVLLMKLAEMVCPGFRIDYGLKRRGPKGKWDAIKYTHLLADVAALNIEKKRTDAQACRDLVEAATRIGRGRYYPSTKKNGKTATKAETIGSLQARLSEARSPKFNPIMEIFDARAKRNPQGVEADMELVAKYFHGTKFRE